LVYSGEQSDMPPAQHAGILNLQTIHDPVITDVGKKPDTHSIRRINNHVPDRVTIAGKPPAEDRHGLALHYCQPGIIRIFALIVEASRYDGSGKNAPARQSGIEVNVILKDVALCQKVRICSDLNQLRCSGNLERIIGIPSAPFEIV
jgi:hypothetical protein